MAKAVNPSARLEPASQARPPKRTVIRMSASGFTIDGRDVNEEFLRLYEPERFHPKSHHRERLRTEQLSKLAKQVCQTAGIRGDSGGKVDKEQKPSRTLRKDRRPDKPAAALSSTAPMAM